MSWFKVLNLLKVYKYNGTRPRKVKKRKWGNCVGNGFENSLIVSNSEKSSKFFIDSLNSIGCNKNIAVGTCGEARRLLIERDFDICIINSPLIDESGEKLAKDIATMHTCQVLLVVKMEYYNAISSKVEDFGVVTIGKPLNKNIFWANLKFLKASYNHIQKIKVENRKLTQKIKDIKLVDKAKYLLISYEFISEEVAHKRIEKEAMDLRITKREVAEKILEKYENM